MRNTKKYKQILAKIFFGILGRVFSVHTDL
jgi:hypothetical protein